MRARVEAGERPEDLAVELGVKVATVRGRTRPRPGEAGAAKRPVRLNAAQRLRICQLFTGGMTAQRIADEYDVCKGTVTNILREGKCRRFDLGQRAHRRLTSEEREALLGEAPEPPDAAVRALAPGATFSEAAEAAGWAAVAHLRQARPGQCLAYLKTVSAFRRLVAEIAGAAPADPFADTPGRRAALAGLREVFGLPKPDGDDEISLPFRGGAAAPAAWVGGAEEDGPPQPSASPPPSPEGEGEKWAPPTRSLCDLPSPEGEGER